MDANLKLEKYEKAIKTIETHTVGEYTRVVIDGFWDIPGNTMIEKKHWLEENADQYRKALMLEPKGHHDMFGSILTKPVSDEADYGVIFLDTGGYLNMCVHGSIGTSTALVEGGLVEVKEPVTEIVLEAPAGLIRASVQVKDGKTEKVTIKNVPAFLYKKGLKATVDGIDVDYDISFGGSFFALVDAEQFGKKITRENLRFFQDFGDKLRDEINNTIEIQHPERDITTVDLIEFYAHTDSEGCDLQNVVIFGDRMADRSPCGTGTCAKMAMLHAIGELPINQEFVYESIIGSRFYGKLLGETKVGEFDAVYPQVTGSAYINGTATWVIDGDDPLKYGFTPLV